MFVFCKPQETNGCPAEFQNGERQEETAGNHEMRKPRGVQIRANRLIGPREVLGGDDRRVPAKGRGRTAPYRGRSGASWIWSTPLATPARARGSSVRATPSLHPPRILKTISLFYRKEDPEKSRLRGRLQLFFLSLVWGFPIVAAGIPFVVDQSAVSLCDADFQIVGGHSNPQSAEIYDRRRRRVTRNIVERISM